MLRDLLAAGWNHEEAALLTAVAGEVGNNCFDHNLGRWPDEPGCVFGCDVAHEPPLVWIVDRGVGVLETLRRADPNLKSAQQALDAAFTRVLSGRTPERRGNGLKFVRSVVNSHARRALYCRSGDADAGFGGLAPALKEAQDRLATTTTAGVAVLIGWRPV